jgi:TrmH family RNA methyltransferase
MAKTIRLYAENADFQHVETLRRNRQKRHRYRQFFVEGVRAINAALSYGWTIDAFYYSAEGTLSSWAQEVLENSAAQRHYALSQDLMRKLSQKNEGSELLAVLAMPEETLERLPSRTDLLLVLLDRCSNPGNLGTVIRSCDALGAHGLIMTGHSVDLYDPEVIRASVGSIFAIPIVRLPSHQDVWTWLEQNRLPLQVIGSSARASKLLYQANLQKPSLILIGNETAGLSAAYLELAHELVKIPMREDSFATSLNMACATTSILYEAQRQRSTL